MKHEVEEVAWVALSKEEDAAEYMVGGEDAGGIRRRSDEGLRGVACCRADCCLGA